jgi:hypothetical protein
MTVVTSAGNDGTTMRLYSHRNTGQDDHWASYTISGGKAVFTAPDNSVYGKTATYYGTGWRFYREKDGGWSSVVTTPFAYPPAGSTFNF